MSLNESVELPNYPLERTAGSPALAAAAQRCVRLRGGDQRQLGPILERRGNELEGPESR
jgi:hypothetical protein